jgi:hypothetical protein
MSEVGASGSERKLPHRLARFRGKYKPSASGTLRNEMARLSSGNPLPRDCGRMLLRAKTDLDWRASPPLRGCTESAQPCENSGRGPRV